jgi:murein DD-endopeptidase MepM/ murein hydrolase activator NlpD
MSEPERRAGCGPAAAGLVGFVLGAATVLLIVWATLRPDTRQDGPAPVVTPGVRAAPGEAVPPAPAAPGAPQAAPRTRPPALTPTGHVTPDLPVVPPPPDLRRRDLLLPVQGVERETLRDTYQELRGGGRVHEALDIMAPRGTPVLAVEAGRIAKLFKSERGGLTIYQFDPTATYAYYYAHLDRYAPALAEGAQVRRGQVLGYVGATGNAADPHLHFAIFRLGPEKRWWQGTAVNPFPLFRDELAATAPPAR